MPLRTINSIFSTTVDVMVIFERYCTPTIVGLQPSCQSRDSLMLIVRLGASGGPHHKRAAGRLFFRGRYTSKRERSPSNFPKGGSPSQSPREISKGRHTVMVSLDLNLDLFLEVLLDGCVRVRTRGKRSGGKSSWQARSGHETLISGRVAPIHEL